MTSIAFAFGSLPLAIATGASAASRIAIGTAVVGGIVGATALTIFFVPVFFVTVLHLFRRGPRRLPDIQRKACVPRVVRSAPMAVVALPLG
jgi:multidrug efflux pump